MLKGQNGVYILMTGKANKKAALLTITWATIARHDNSMRALPWAQDRLSQSVLDSATHTQLELQ
jgi:hypothetical protein